MEQNEGSLCPRGGFCYRTMYESQKNLEREVYNTAHVQQRKTKPSVAGKCGMGTSSTVTGGMIRENRKGSG